MQEMTSTDYLCQEKEEKNLPVLKIQRHKDYIEKGGGRLITATRNNMDNTRINWKEISKKQ